MLALLALLARAQDAPVSPARQCADAAEGTAVDVCMQLAAQNPDQVDRVVAALRARIDRGSAPDRELLLLLLLLLSEDTGPEGARQLGELGDPRGVPPLVHAAETRSLPVATAAVAALSRYEEGFDPLRNWLVDRQQRLGVRVAAAEALGRMKRVDAADALVDALRRRGTPIPLRQAMLASMTTHYPDRVAELDHQVGTDGRWWLAAGSAWALGYGLGAAGHFGQTNLVAVGAITGGVAGGTTGFFVGQANPWEAGDAAFFATSGMAGTVGGATLGAAFSTDAAWLGGIVGGGVGYGLGYGLRNVHQGKGGDSGEMLFVTTGFGIGTATLSGFLDRNWQLTNPSIVGGIGILSGAVLGHLLTPNVQVYGAADYALVSLGAAYGLGLGSLIPIGDADRALLPIAGLSLGAVTGFWLDGPLEAHWDRVAGGYMGLVYSASFGAGVGLLIDPKDLVFARAGGLIAGTVGMGLGSFLARVDPDPLDDRDIVLGGLLTVWAVGQGFGWYSVAERDTLLGLIPLLPAVTVIPVMVFSNDIDWPITNSFAATSIGLWGGYLGGVTAALADADPLPTGLIVSNVGLVAGGFVLSPYVGTPALVIALGDAGGVLLGAGTAVAASLSTANSDVVLLASAIGAASGFAVGAGIGTALHRSGVTRDVAVNSPRFKRVPRVVLEPTAVPKDHRTLLPGAQLRIDRW